MVVDVGTVVVSLATALVSGITVALYTSRRQHALERLRWRRDACTALLREANTLLLLVVDPTNADEVARRHTRLTTRVWDVELVAPRLRNLAYNIEGALSFYDVAGDVDTGSELLRPAIDAFREAAQRDLGTRPALLFRQRAWLVDRRLTRQLGAQEREWLRSQDGKGDVER